MIGTYPVKAFALFLSLTCLSVTQVEAFGDGDRGRTIYQQRCSHCHGVDGHGNNGMAADFGKEWHRLTKSDTELMQNLKNGFSTPGRTYLAGQCPPQLLSERDMRDVLSYLKASFLE